MSRKSVMASFDDLFVGEKLHDYHMYKMGATRMRTEGHWTLTVVELDSVSRRAYMSWNSNPPTWYSEERIRKFRLVAKEKK